MIPPSVQAAKYVGENNSIFPFDFEASGTLLLILSTVLILVECFFCLSKLFEFSPSF